ncbi:MAG TPA: hypothetical protein VFE30_11200 [Anaeromyxobacteraceae bacterium]|jgi:hypothetical protein|nr:hypothetical protein [Anaeromyxobacteraceae bacterium]
MLENAFQRAALLLAPVLLLAGCGSLFSAEVQDSSVAVTRDFPGMPGLSRLGAAAGPVDVPTPVTFPVKGTFNADIPLTGQNQGGTFKVTTIVTLNGAEVAMKSTSGGDLSGVSAAELQVYDPSADPSAAQAKTIATYARPAAGPADPTRLHLAKSGAINLADYLANQRMGLQLLLTVQGPVNFPQQDWTAALTLDLYVDSKAEGP